LDREDRRLDGEINEVYAILSEKRGERERLYAAKGAEHAAFARACAEAEIIEVARRWAVLKLASTLLSGAMDSYRRLQGDPLISRAGEFFRLLTGGAFAALAHEYGDDDRPHILGQRTSGERVAIGHLSDGTRDQLYLALRLAFLEDYCSRNEPAPFVCDDVFQTFDDDRTAAGLRTLAAANTCFQPILFAHHRGLVDIARDVLGEAVDVISL
jgi:uncharacterized protein YhaN